MLPRCAFFFKGERREPVFVGKHCGSSDSREMRRSQVGG